MGSYGNTALISACLSAAVSSAVVANNIKEIRLLLSIALEGNYILNYFQNYRTPFSAIITIPL